MRVVSVLPSATEIVYALGHGRELVARSAECDFPPEAQQLPVVMRPRTLDAERRSAEIDARVRAARSTGESLYELDIERLRALRPELLLTQDLCGVCSVTDREVAEACATAGVAPRIVSVAPRRLSEVWQSIRTIGQALGDAEGAERLAASLEGGPETGPTDLRPRVAVVEWLDPPILAGLWTPDIVRAGGGEPVGPSSGAVGERTTWAAIAGLRPDLLILSPCSFSVERSRRELTDRPLASRIAAVRPLLGTFVADEAYFSRPGPRLAHGVSLVRSLLARSPDRPPMPVVPWDREVGEAAP